MMLFVIVVDLMIMVIYDVGRHDEYDDDEDDDDGDGDVYCKPSRGAADRLLDSGPWGLHAWCLGLGLRLRV